MTQSQYDSMMKSVSENLAEAVSSCRDSNAYYSDKIFMELCAVYMLSGWASTSNVTGPQLYNFLESVRSLLDKLAHARFPEVSCDAE